MEQNKKYDVGILGVWSGCNYGSIATYYALNQAISSLGYSVLMIDKPRISDQEDAELSMTHARRFANEHYNISNSYRLQDLHKLNELCDTFVIGSDQVWNYGISKNFGKSFYFDFTEDSKKRLAYAASFGHGVDFAPENERDVISRLMKRFDAVSVREKEGVRLCNEIYDIRAEQVLDPVFLVDRKIFDDLAVKSSFKQDEKYIATYILDPTPEKREALLYVSEKLGYKLVNMLDGLPWLYKGNREKLGLDAEENIQVEDWIACFRNSEFVITDSCHGASFALIYEKNFIPITNKRRGYSRFKSLGDLFGFKDRLVSDPVKILNDESLFSPMDYGRVNSILKREKERCWNWLKNALEMPSGQMHLFASPAGVITSRLDTTMCTGCSSCISVCPVGALSLKPDEWGYYRASLDSELCINCGKCTRVCPALELPLKTNRSEPDCYAFIASDEKLLYNSSSGGIFSLLAEETFRRNGYVVGAAWKDDFSVEHIIIDHRDDLYKLQKSKYLQSYLGNTLKRVKDKLDIGSFVLFSGCPCQIAGLKAYLGKDYDNLLLVDLLCGNSPSSMFFRKYVEESFPQGIKEYQFRYKGQGWNSDCVKLTLTDGSTLVRRGGAEDNYQKVYHNHTMCAPHCEKCRYQELPRFGDLTIGDFWGLIRKAPDISTKKGVSVILCNNNKGKYFLDSIPEEAVGLKRKVPLQWIGGNGYALKGSHNHCSPQRDIFYQTIKNLSFSKALDAIYQYQQKTEYRKIYENSEVLLRYDTSFRFRFDTKIWDEGFLNGVTVLTVKQNAVGLGHYAVLPLCKRLTKGKRYRFQIRFKTKTSAPAINLHVKDSGSKTMQIIYVFNVSDSNKEQWVDLETEFSAKSDLFDEFMIGAAHIRGEGNYFAVEYIGIEEIQI